MIRLAWLNRFLTLLVFLLFFFVMTVGSIIVNETSLTARQPFIEESMDDQVMAIPSPTPKARVYTPAPASASASVKQVYNHMNTRHEKDLYIQPASNKSSTFDEGYDWAVAHTVKQRSQCNQLTDESYEGCVSFIEVNHYVKQAQSNLNL